MVEDGWAMEWKTAFHDWLARQRRDKTRRGYRRIWGLFMEICAKPPGAVQPADVAAWRAWLGGEQYAKSTIQMFLSGIRSFYREAVRLGLTASNPVEPEADREDYSSGRYLSEEEEAALLGAIDQDTTWGRRDYAIILFLLRSGRRLAEILELRWGDFEVGKDGVWYHWGEAKPGYERKRARLDWEVWAAICMHLEGGWPLEAAGRPKAGGRLENIQPGDVIFTRLTDTTGVLRRRFGEAWNRFPLSEHFFGTHLHVYASWAELPEGAVTPKTLRYTGAVRKWNAEHDFEALQAYLGYVNRDVTLRWIKEVAGSIAG